MKNNKIIVMLLLLLIFGGVSVFSQIAATNSGGQVQTVQPKIMVIPYTKENHNSKTLSVFGSLISIRTESIKTALTNLKQEETV